MANDVSGLRENSQALVVAALFDLVQAQAVPIPESQNNKPQARRRLRIALADDDRDGAHTLAALLEQEGHEVVEIYRGDAVLDIVKRYQPDAVLLDIGMPGLTGFEVARRLQEEPRQHRPLLIAVTAWTQSAAKEMARLVGFDHYLTKPYSTDDLLNLLAPLTSPKQE